MFGFNKNKQEALDSQKHVFTGTYDYSQALQDIRHNIGPAPRKFTRRDRLNAPDWMNHPAKDKLYILVAQNQRLFEQGRIVWGAMVQANVLIFELGPDNVPGNMIYSFDPRMDAMPQFLSDIAANLFNFKGESGAPSGVQNIANAMADEFERLMKVKLPPEIALDYEIFFTGDLFDRKHLKNGILASRILPMLAHPDMDATMIVPHWYWPDSLHRVLAAA